MSAAVGDALALHGATEGRVAIGLSGGVDSVALLHALAGLRGEPLFRHLRLTAVHVNHGISRSADEWERFCRAWCERLDIPCLAVRVTVERGSRDGLEAAARRARYAAFATVEADWLVLAHHRDDQAETLLFNLLRGTGLAGASAMRELSGRILRPWLGIDRDRIVAYARMLGLDWCEDDSNADIRHARNFLRRQIMPELRRRFPAAARNLAAAARRFAESQALLDELARLDLGAAPPDFPLDVTVLSDMSEPRARNLMRYLLARRGVQIPSEARLRELLRQMLDAGIDRHPAVKFGDCVLRRRKGRIYLEPAGPISESR